LEVFPFVGSDRGQDAKDYVHQGQAQLYQSKNAHRPEELAKTKVAPLPMEVQEVEAIQIPESTHVPIDLKGQCPYNEGNGYHTGQDGIEQKTDLEVQCLLAIIVHKGVLVLIGHPKDQGQDEVAKGKKVLGEHGGVDYCR